MSKNPATQAATSATVPPITLDSPIVRGEQTITSVQLRKPAAGELRGVALSDLLQMDVAALQTVLPRITSPALTTHDVAQLDPADLVQLAGGVVSFLLPKAAREAASLDA